MYIYIYIPLRSDGHFFRKAFRAQGVQGVGGLTEGPE